MKSALLYFLFLGSVIANAQDLYTSEKVYLHTDRETYISGDTVWLKSYIVDAQTHHFSELSGLLYVKFIDNEGKNLDELKLKIKNGQADGFWLIPSTSNQQKIQLVAYTNLMRNHDEALFFRKNIELINNNAPKAQFQANWNVQFFPEGGNLINRLASKIAFKAINEKGQGINIKGSIVDERENVLTEIQTSYLGMGIFEFKPEINHVYQAKVTVDGKTKLFLLPTILNEGIALKIDAISNENEIKIDINSNTATKQNLSLKAHLRGKLIFEQSFINENPTHSFSLPFTKIAQNGIVHFTLFDENSLPIAERLAFVNEFDNSLKFETNATQNDFKPNQPITLHFDIKHSNSPQNGIFSVSVVDESQVISTENLSMNAYLLLNSDLKGTIEQPNLYFEEGSSKSNLDNLMLTQGWRRFTWKEIKKEMPFEVEKNLILAGNAFKSASKPAKNENIKFVVWDKKGLRTATTKTDQNGYFELACNWQDSVKIVTTDSKNRDLIVEFETHSLNYFKLLEPQKNQNIAFLKTIIDNSLSMQEANGTEVLEEVVVVEKVNPLKFDSRRVMYGGEPDFELPISESMRNGTPNLALLLDGRLPGIPAGAFGFGAFKTIREDDFNEKMQKKGESLSSSSSGEEKQATKAPGGTIAGTDVLVLLDGKPLQKDMYDMVNVGDIEQVDLLRSISNTAIFGIQAGNGKVVNILTRRGKISTDSYNQKRQQKWKGYAIEKEFYSPKYSNNSINKPDRRPTLYWNPNVQTDANGKATISFYNSDIAKKFLINIQGTDGKGNVGSLQKVVE